MAGGKREDGNGESAESVLYVRQVFYTYSKDVT